MYFEKSGIEKIIFPLNVFIQKATISEDLGRLDGSVIEVSFKKK